ncbi:MAG: hypothetical protein M3Y72_21280 [Acidobacteriota bacterium]|nr:hypothetical protein [Acidobacteriota bacterium]
MTSSFDQNAPSAVLNFPSPDQSGVNHSLTCLFHGMEGKRLVIECPDRPSCRAAVSVEFNDALFLGEIVTANPGAKGYWRAEIQVEQVLTGLQSLMILRERLLNEGAGATVSRSPVAMCG